MDKLSAVRGFQSACGQTLNEKPTLPSKDVIKLRIDMLKEEVKELELAFKENDLVKVLDAFVDIDYVNSGGINECGLQDVYPEGFRLVHENNLTKIGEDGTVTKDKDGKVTKPEGFTPVRLDHLIK
jgi:predicted HAD superfamily Cof-like phosphohydrolase